MSTLKDPITTSPLRAVDIPMLPNDVDRRVAGVRAMRTDDEAAHAEEDHLHRDVLTAIALGALDPIGLARAAMRTQDIQFERWGA